MKFILMPLVIAVVFSSCATVTHDRSYSIKCEEYGIIHEGYDGPLDGVCEWEHIQLADKVLTVDDIRFELPEGEKLHVDYERNDSEVSLVIKVDDAGGELNIRLKDGEKTAPGYRVVDAGELKKTKSGAKLRLKLEPIE